MLSISYIAFLFEHYVEIILVTALKGIKKRYSAILYGKLMYPIFLCYFKVTFNDEILIKYYSLLNY